MYRAYYNEFDPFAAEWLKMLIACGHIVDGDVDTRSIEDVQPSDLAGYTQCHFFAGIGGWSYALRLAGWPDSTPVWTGSCPCQPFSAAGKGGGFADERHLWPAFFHLITQREPPTIFGEQVASKDGLEWLSLVQNDLEAAGYTAAATDLCAASVGAPITRQRVFWLAGSASKGGCRWSTVENRSNSQFRRSSENLWITSWPDGFGSGSNEPVSEVLQASYGVSNRMGRLRGYGNAIVPQVAAEFIRAFMELHS